MPILRVMRVLRDRLGKTFYFSPKFYLFPISYPRYPQHPQGDPDVAPNRKPRPPNPPDGSTAISPV